jgi:hypothetical protein
MPNRGGLLRCPDSHAVLIVSRKQSVEFQFFIALADI